MTIMTTADYILFSGGAPGAEAEFGACAERHGIEEVNFTFDGHNIARHRGVRVLNHEELQAGDVSLAYVSRLMHRRYTDSPTIRKVLQTLWYQVNHGQEIYIVGAILDDGTVRGGTGWGAEFAKLCNKPLFVFDQDKDGWFRWAGDDWDRVRRADDQPSALHGQRHAVDQRQRQEGHRGAVREVRTNDGQERAGRSPALREQRSAQLLQFQPPRNGLVVFLLRQFDPREDGVDVIGG